MTWENNLQTILSNDLYTLNKTKGAVYMTYEEYVKDIFIEHHNCIGQDLEEALDAYNDSTFKRVEQWLIKIGYDLNEYNLI